MPRVAKAKPGAVKKAPGGKKNKLYVMPEAIPLGEVITDISKTQWKIGPSIGCGGFGEIYSACRLTDAAKTKPENYDCVVKCEPHGNGPLFVEMHFYMRNAKIDEIKAFKKSHGLKHLGMPHILGSGSHDINSQKHRFVVMPRYGKDVMKFFLENCRKIPEATIYRLAMQMIDVYEYVHTCGYVHADLKGANILLGYGKGGSAQAYLVDYGLASHYTTKDFKPDPKKMHNGTVEYTSRDAHQGVATMRADFEILGYNLIEWSGVQLPWVRDNLLATPVKVQKSKEDFMSDVSANLKKLFSKAVPVPIADYMKYVAQLEFNGTPDYEKCRKIFATALKTMKVANSGDLDFKLKSSPLGKAKFKATQAATAGEDSDVLPSDDDESDAIFERKQPVKSLKNKKNQQSPNRKMASPVKKTPKKETPIKKTKLPSPLKGGSHSTRSTPISANANINFSPVVSLHRSKPGKTIINDNLTPNSKSGNTYEFNFELDVSMDANVVVNVKRKKKFSKATAATPSKSVVGSESPVTRVKVRKLDSAESATCATPASESRRKRILTPRSK